jgi:phospholipid/cholesterol/gamma-HCH transport system substrate-binding protein
LAGGKNTLLRDALVGAMVLGAVLLLAYMATSLGSVGRGGGRTVTMVFDDATGLIETAPIAVSGVKVGAVRTIEYDERGAKVVATIREDVKLYTDARAAVKAKSLLGEKFVSIMPGNPASGALGDGEIKTLPSADIDRMAAAIARIAEQVDPADVKQIAHGLAVALGEDGIGTSVPETIRDVGRDLHRLTTTLEGATGSAKELATELKPLLAKLDALATKTDKTLDRSQPTLERLPETLAAFERAAKRIDALIARAEKVDIAQLEHDLKTILQEEGVYVRMSSRKVKDPKKPGKPEPEKTSEPEPENPFERKDSPVPR